MLGRRADGYHLLDSLVAFANVGDRLGVAAAAEITLACVGPFAAALAGPGKNGGQPSAAGENLVLRAARALADGWGVTEGAALVLEKSLPVASGIGGGSADAAASLRLLARHWGLAPPPGALAQLAAGLGADVPVCLHPGAARMQGVGDILLPCPPLPPCGLVLVNPGVAVATAEVFRARTGAFSAPALLRPSWPDAAALAADLAVCRNDLEAPALGLAPVIGEVLAALRTRPEVLLARMSGSGATCFGLCPDPGAAARAAAALARPGWWCRSGGIFPSPH